MLLEVARQSLTLAAEGREPSHDLPVVPEFDAYGGAFVTLRQRGRLRGCIGQIESTGPLVQVVAHCARAVASEDPRFNPVRADELGGIEIELSILSIAQEIAPNRIEVGKHGLIVSRGLQRGVLLPQVAGELHWTAGKFLEQTCVKAGLEPEAWRNPETRIHGFTAEIFGEADFRTEDSSGRETRTKSRYSIST